MNNKPIKNLIRQFKEDDVIVTFGNKTRVTDKTVMIYKIEEWEYNFRIGKEKKTTHHPGCFEVTIDWIGESSIRRFETEEEVSNFITSAIPSEMFFLTWNEVTCNGRFSCE